LYNGLAAIFENISGFHDSGLNNFESLTFFTKKATPTMAATAAADPTTVNATVAVVVTAFGVKTAAALQLAD